MTEGQERRKGRKKHTGTGRGIIQLARIARKFGRVGVISRARARAELLSSNYRQTIVATDPVSEGPEAPSLRRAENLAQVSSPFVGMRQCFIFAREFPF